MQYRESWAELVPPARGARYLADPLAQRAFGRAQDELESLGVPDQLDALYWVFRIAEETEQLNRLSSRVPWLDRLSVGFIDEGEGGFGPAFGIICYTNYPEETIPLQITDQFTIDSGIDVGPYFRAIIRAGSRVAQVGITAPSQAIATTWSTSQRTQQGGWLVPAHAVDPSTTVQFSDGTSGTVTESWGSCIDAVLVTPTGAPSPAGLSRRFAVRGVAPGTPVSVEDGHQNIHNSTVLDVDVNLGVVRHHLFPIRFSYDWTTSKQGDSGALVVADPCGEPTGMHQGMFKWQPALGAPSQHAYALCLYQLEDYGGLEVYQ